VRVGERRIGGAHVFWTDRHGGISSGRYAELNLADNVGDLAGAVAENRLRVARAVAARIAADRSAGAPTDRGGDPGPTTARIVWLRQVHGSRVHAVTALTCERAASVPPVADAAVTAETGIGLAVLAADCVPIALACEGAVGVVHAGWKGMIRGVVEAAVAEMRRTGGARVKAMIGPCIHAGRYEFGSSDLDRVADHLGPRVVALTDGGAPALDLPAAARVVLERSGVAGEDVESIGVCTAASADCFSHRRDGATGRHAMIAVRRQ